MTKEKFESLVVNAALNKLNLTLPNSTAEKAAFVMINLFKSARQHIKLLVNNLDSDITNSPGYNEALEDAIKRGVEVSILYRQTPNKLSSSNKLLDLLEQSGNRNIHRKLMNESAIEKLDSYNINNGELFFFSESDNTMFRFEFDKNKHHSRKAIHFDYFHSIYY